MEFSYFIFGAAALILYVIYVYNKVIGLKQAMSNNRAQISIQLDVRSKKFDSLINTVKKAMDYENATLTKIVELRNKIINLGKDSLDSNERVAAENELSEIVNSGALSKAIDITVEAYPELKANNNMQILQEEIISVENKLGYAKQAYHDSIERYNVYTQSFPPVLIVGMFSSLKANDTYWELSAEDKETKENSRVEF